MSASKQPTQAALIATLIAHVAFGLIAMIICLPSLQEWGQTFQASQSTVQWCFTGYLLAFGGMQLVYGPLSDQYGRKVVILAGLSLAVVATLIAGMATGLPVLIAARVLQGAGCAAGMVVGRAAVQDFFSGPERTKVMAYVGMVTGFCPPVATIIGGQMHVRFGWQSNFWLIGALALGLFILTLSILPSKRVGSSTMGQLGQDVAPISEAPPEPHVGLWIAFSRLIREPRFIGYAGIVATISAAFYAFLGAAPLVLKNYGVGPDGIGWFIALIPISFVTGNFLTSRLVTRVGEHRMMMRGQWSALIGVSLILLMGVLSVHSPLALVLPLLFIGLGHGMLMPPSLGGTVGTIPALAGSAAALAGLAQQLMGAFGSYLVGLLDHQGLTPLGIVMLIFTMLGFAAQRLLLQRNSF